MIHFGNVWHSPNIPGRPCCEQPVIRVITCFSFCVSTYFWFILLNYFFSYFQLNQSILLIVYIECYRLEMSGSDTLTIYSFAILYFFSPFLRHPTLQAEPFCLLERRLCFNRFKPLMLATHLKRLDFSIFCFFSRQTVFFTTASTRLLINRWSQLSPL